MPADLVMAILIVVLLVYQFGVPYILTYRFTDEDVRAVLFGVAAVSVRRYQFIREVHTISPLATLFFMGWRAQNRFVGQGVMVISSGGMVFFGAVLYTPDNVEGFARELRRRVYQQTGRLPLGS